MAFCSENTSTDVDVYIRYLHLPWKYFISRHLWRHANNLMIFLTVNMLLYWVTFKMIQIALHGSSVQLSDVFTSCVEKYETHGEETRSGTHGTTAQSWIMYVDYVHDFHNLERAIRTNDIDLFLHVLTPIINLFVATNHINYSRWLSKFQLDLLNIDSILTLVCVTS